MHVHDILSRRSIIDDLGAFNNTIWPKIATTLPGQDIVDECPVCQIRRRIARDMLKRRVAGIFTRLIFSKPVVGRSDLDHPATMSLNIVAVIVIKGSRRSNKNRGGVCLGDQETQAKENRKENRKEGNKCNAATLHLRILS